MTSRIIQPGSQAPVFPRLMWRASSEAIILFTGETTGTQLYTRSGQCLGLFHTRWGPLGWELFDGEVNLSNSGEGCPCLKRHAYAGHVVLFSSEGVGTTVFSPSYDEPLGRFYNERVESLYRPFHGTVILKNTELGVRSTARG